MMEFQESSEAFSYDFSEVEETTPLDAVKSGSFVGIYENLPNEIYHRSPGLSFSGLKEFAKTPAHYQAYLRRERKPTPAQILGTRVHMAVLEPELFEKTYAVAPKISNYPNALDTVEQMKVRCGVLGLKISGTKSELKARIKEADPKAVFWEDLCKDLADGKEIIEHEKYDQVRFMADSILNHPDAAPLFSKGASEVSVFWKCPVTGILKKCRPDRLWIEQGIVPDIKTFGDDLSDKALEDQIYRSKYHWQSRHYLEGVSHVRGLQTKMFVHVFVMDQDPWLTRVKVLTDEALEKAAEEMAPLLPQFAECMKTKKWPGYPSGYSEATLPYYAFNR